MRNAFLVSCGLLSVGFLASVSRADFVFTRIADSTQGYSNFSFPSVNDGGLVAFRADTASGMTGIFTGTGGTVATAITRPLNTIAGPAAINDAGQISFVDFAADGTGRGIAVNRITGGTVTTIYSDPTHFSPQLTTIANDGTVYFTGSQLPATGPSFFASGNGGAVTYYVHPTNLTDAEAMGQPVVNSRGQGAVSYINTSGAGINDRINLNGTDVFSNFSQPYESPQGPVPLHDVGAVGLNAADDIVFSAAYTSPPDSTNVVTGVFRLANGQLTKLADGRAVPAINDRGVLAGLFTTADGATKTLIVGNNDFTDRVLATGDAFMGSTVTDLGFLPMGLSNGDQLAFYAKLADGREGIYLTVVPEPSVLALLVLGLVVARRRVL